MRRYDISGLCEICGDVKAAHTLRQLRECRGKIKAPSADAVRRYQESRRAQRPEAQKLDIPPKIRQGRQRAIKAQERGAVVAPEDAEARRAYARLRWEQVPPETRKRSTKVSMEAKARRRAKGEPDTKRTHVRTSGGRPLCGQMPRNEGTKPVFAACIDKVTCKRCLTLQDDNDKPNRRPSRPLKLHAPLARDGSDNQSVAFCGMPGVNIATDGQDVTCRKCLELLTPRKAPANVRAWCYNQTLSLLREKHQNEFDESFAALLVLAGYEPESTGS